MIPTPAQIRAARVLLELQQTELASKAGLSVRTLVVVEQGKGAEASHEKVVAALNSEGIVFGGSPDGRSLSVQLRRP